VNAQLNASDREVPLAVEPFLNDFFGEQCHVVFLSCDCT
jgi:hypothetical protein